MRGAPITLVLMLAACGDDGAASLDVDAGAPGAPDAGRACLDRATHALTIDAGAFPPTADHPSVLV
ncbi:MAG: hypothetical protein H0T79_12160, partial [Deltaproteobacteria bacterium]|nr:hypothetical protein [Deltaproteobacteria bacterium]